MVVVDSVGWIVYFMGHPSAERYRSYIKNQSELICPTVVVYEVGKKIEIQVDRQAAATAVAQLLKTRVVPLGHSLAAAAAQTSIAFQIPMADAIIYTTATLAGVRLITSDAHLKDLPGVEFIPIPSG
jgi:toxin FitB